MKSVTSIARPRTVLFFLAGLLASATALAQSSAPGFDVNGKYHNLVDQFGCAADVDVYGTFSDYGWWGGGFYCGAERPAGYYVFYQGAWAVWESGSGTFTVPTAIPRPPPNPSPPPPGPTRTTTGPGFDVNGKYTNLIDQFGCAADVATYGEFNDFGWWAGGPYCGADRPPGYYVFYQGAWAVWKDASGILPGAPPAVIPTAGPGFDVNGRYYDLIEQFGCAADVAIYGEFNDYGWWAGGPYCGAVRPAGFYVFYQGAWAVWATAK